ISNAAAFTVRSDLENLSTDGALDRVLPAPTKHARMRSKVILFVTNREIDLSAEDRARSDSTLLRYEDVFRNAPAVSTSYGYAVVSYPTNRSVGGQNYYTWRSNLQNPLYHFSVVDHLIIRSPDEFRELSKMIYSKAEDPLLYVHGFNTSFSDAAEALTQLVV